MSGVFKTKRTISWKFAYMYDGDGKYWMIRETGFTIGVPELFGHIFVGRTKEGYSHGQSNERPFTMDCRKADGIGCYSDFSRWYKMVWLLAKIENILESWIL